MKKILCLVSYTYLPAKTGGQKSIASFYQQLSKHFNLLCIGTKSNDVSKASYRMHNIFSSAAFRYINPINYFKIKIIIRNEQPDYIQLEHPYLGWLAVLLRNTTNTKLIVRSHNIEGLRFRNLGKWWWSILMQYEGWVHRSADINYFISDEDKQYALDKYKINNSTAYTITFGINPTAPPTCEQTATAKANVIKEHNLNTTDKIILFNGAFDYRPNTIALYNLVQNIFPLIHQPTDYSFKLLICGKDIPADLIDSNTNSDIIFAGFVPDIVTYVMAADVFVNPITEGGGIKTKLVEALAYNVTSVSFFSGAIGVSPTVCGDKLVVIPDDEIENFANAIVEASKVTSTIPETFYEQFSLEKIVKRLTQIL